MQQPLQITVRDFPHSEALDAHIRDKAAKLESLFPDIVGCRVVVELPHRHKHQGKPFNVRLEIKVPGDELVVNRDRHEDVYVALRDAFDAAKRQLEDYARKLRGAVKVHEPVVLGKVTRIFPEEGFGFIESRDGRELYFHRENVVSSDFDRLDVGAEVRFIEEMGGEGWQAKRVTAGKHRLPQ